MSFSEFLQRYQQRMQGNAPAPTPLPLIRSPFNPMAAALAPLAPQPLNTPSPEVMALVAAALQARALPFQQEAPPLENPPIVQSPFTMNPLQAPVAPAPIASAQSAASTYATPPEVQTDRYSGQILGEPRPTTTPPPALTPEQQDAAVVQRQTDEALATAAVERTRRLENEVADLSSRAMTSRDPNIIAQAQAKREELAAAERAEQEALARVPTTGPLEAAGQVLDPIMNEPLRRVEEYQAGNMVASARAGRPVINNLPDVLGVPAPEVLEDGPAQIQWAIDNAPAVTAAYENGYIPATGAYAGQTLTGERAVWEFYAQQLNVWQRGVLAMAMDPANLPLMGANRTGRGLVTLGRRVAGDEAMEQAARRTAREAADDAARRASGGASEPLPNPNVLIPDEAAGISRPVASPPNEGIPSPERLPTNAQRIAGRGIEGVGRILQAPQAVLDRTADAAIPAGVRALGMAGRAVTPEFVSRPVGRLARAAVAPAARTLDEIGKKNLVGALARAVQERRRNPPVRTTPADTTMTSPGNVPGPQSFPPLAQPRALPEPRTEPIPLRGPMEPQPPGISGRDPRGMPPPMAPGQPGISPRGSERLIPDPNARIQDVPEIAPAGARQERVFGPAAPEQIPEPMTMPNGRRMVVIDRNTRIKEYPEGWVTETRRDSAAPWSRSTSRENRPLPLEDAWRRARGDVGPPPRQTAPNPETVAQQPLVRGTRTVDPLPPVQEELPPPPVREEPPAPAAAVIQAPPPEPVPDPPAPRVITPEVQRELDRTPTGVAERIDTLTVARPDRWQTPQFRSIYSGLFGYPHWLSTMPATEADRYPVLVNAGYERWANLMAERVRNFPEVDVAATMRNDTFGDGTRRVPEESVQDVLRRAGNAPTETVAPVLPRTETPEPVVARPDVEDLPPTPRAATAAPVEDIPPARPLRTPVDIVVDDARAAPTQAEGVAILEEFGRNTYGPRRYAVQRVTRNARGVPRGRDATYQDTPEGRGWQELDQRIAAFRREESPRGGAPTPQVADSAQAPQTVTLYRVESRPGTGRAVPTWVRQGQQASGHADAQGRWYSNSLEIARWYADDALGEPRLLAIDVPVEQAEAFRVRNVPEAARFSRDPDNEFFLPRDLVATAREVPVPPEWRQAPRTPDVAPEATLPTTYRHRIDGSVMTLRQRPTNPDLWEMWRDGQQVGPADTRGRIESKLARNYYEPEGVTPEPRTVQTPQGPQAVLPGAEQAMRPTFEQPRPAVEVPPQRSAAPALNLEPQVLDTPAARRQNEVLNGQQDIFAARPEPTPIRQEPEPETWVKGRQRVTLTRAFAPPPGRTDAEAMWDATTSLGQSMGRYSRREMEQRMQSAGYRRMAVGNAEPMTVADLRARLTPGTEVEVVRAPYLQAGDPPRRRTVESVDSQGVTFAATPETNGRTSFLPWPKATELTATPDGFELNGQLRYRWGLPPTAETPPTPIRQDIDAAPPGEALPEYRRVPRESVKTDVAKYQNRKELYAEETVENLVSTYGTDQARFNRFMQPIEVKDNGDGTFTVLQGHGRKEAADRLGLPSVPIRIITGTELEVLEAALLGNSLGTRLRPTAEGANLRRQMDTLGKSLEQAAKDSKIKTADARRLVETTYLPNDMQDLVDNGQVPVNLGARLGKAIQDEVMSPADVQSFYRQRVLPGKYTLTQLNDILEGVARHKQNAGVQGATDMFSGLDLGAPQANAVFDTLEKLGKELRTQQKLSRALNTISGSELARPEDSARGKVVQKRIDKLLRDLGKGPARGPASVSEAADEPVYSTLFPGLPQLGRRIERGVRRTAERIDANRPPVQEPRPEWMNRPAPRDPALDRPVDAATVRPMLSQADLRALDQTINSGDLAGMTYLDATDRLLAEGVEPREIVQRLGDQFMAERAAARPRNKVLAPVRDFFGGLTNGLAKLILYRPTTLVRRIVGDTITNAAHAILTGNGEAVLRTPHYLREAWRARTGDDLLDTRLGRRYERSGGGIQYNPRWVDTAMNRDALGASPRAQRTQGRLARILGQRTLDVLGAPINVTRDLITAGDNAFRLALADEVMEDGFRGLIARTRTNAVSRARGAGLNLSETDLNAAIDELVGAGDGPEFAPWDLFRVLRDRATAAGASEGRAFSFADRVARDYVEGRAGVEKAAEKAVNRAFFSYEKTNADELVGKFFLFHYYQSRALRLYITEGIRNPGLAAAYFRAAEGLERQAEEGNYPAAVKNFAKLMNTGGGFTIFFMPQALIANWLMFREQSEGFEGENALERFKRESPLFLGPLIDIGLNLAGAFPNTPPPDPLFSATERAIFGGVFNIARSRGWLGMDAGAGIGDRGYERIWQQAREVTSGVAEGIIPGAQTVPAADPNAYANVQINSLKLDILEEQFGPIAEWGDGPEAWADPEGPWQTALRVMQDPDDPISIEAYQRYSETTTAVAAARAVTPFNPRARVTSRDERTARIDEMRTQAEAQDAGTVQPTAAGTAATTAPASLGEPYVPVYDYDPNLSFRENANAYGQGQQEAVRELFRTGRAPARPQATPAPAPSATPAMDALYDNPEYDALTTARELTNAGSPEAAALLADQQAYYALGTPEGQAAQERWSQVVDGQTAFTVNGTQWTPEDLATLTDKERMTLADYVLIEEGSFDAREQLLAEREAFRAENPEWAAYQNFQKSVRSEPDLEAWRTRTRRGNPNFDQWLTETEDRLRRENPDDAAYEAALDEASDSVKAYLATQGYRISAWDPDPTDVRDPEQDPYMGFSAAPEGQGGAQGGNGTYDPVQSIYDDLADYEAANRRASSLMDPGLTIDDFNPYAQAMLRQQYERTFGEPFPTLQGNARDYMEWAALQPQGASTSVEAFVAWRDRSRASSQGAAITPR